MATDHCESDGTATTCWHSCPRCNHRRMTSEPGLFIARKARRSSVDTEAEAGLGPQGRLVLGLS